MVIEGRVGTPASRIRSFDPIFDPMASMADAGGPTQVRPAPTTALAKSPDSDRNPYPGWTASAEDRAAAASIRSMRR
jgi:hypothetical protein